jgi:hypothetical protein
MTTLALRLHKQSVATSMGAVTALQRVADEKGAPIQNGQRPGQCRQ